MNKSCSEIEDIFRKPLDIHGLSMSELKYKDFTFFTRLSVCFFRRFCVCLFRNHAKSTEWIQKEFGTAKNLTALHKSWEMFHYDRLDTATAEASSYILTFRDRLKKNFQTRVAGALNKYNTVLYIKFCRLDNWYGYSSWVVDVRLRGKLVNVNFIGEFRWSRR